MKSKKKKLNNKKKKLNNKKKKLDNSVNNFYYLYFNAIE